MRYSVITISGQLGSGKSTVAKMLAEKLKWQYYSTGMAQRTIAQKRGISTVELNRLAVSDPKIDEEIDSVFKNPPWGNQPCVVDSRLAFHFLPNSFKVFLKIDLEEAAKRVWLSKGRISEHYTNENEALAYLKKRRELESVHFIKNYHLDIDQMDQFDLVIDTTHTSPEEVCQKILAGL